MPRYLLKQTILKGRRYDVRVDFDGRIDEAWDVEDRDQYGSPRPLDGRLPEDAFVLAVLSSIEAVRP